MYAVVVFALLAVVVAEDLYTTKFDNVDVDEIMKNERLLKSYFNCLMDRGTCTTEGEELKKRISDALATECAKCSEKQKELAKKIFKFLIEKKKDLYAELEAKYDPEHMYRNKYKKQAEAEGIKI